MRIVAMPETSTEVPNGEASPMPPLLYVTLWIPVFAAIVWGMMLLFGRKPWQISEQKYLPPPDMGEGHEPEHHDPPTYNGQA